MSGAARAGGAAGTGSGAGTRTLDLDLEQVRFMLKQQGYVIPEEELVEVTASLNALIEGLSDMQQYGPLQNEPWPVLVGYVGDEHAS